MLSIVPLLAGGGMSALHLRAARRGSDWSRGSAVAAVSRYETGAGGSAPKHVEQFVKENHLRWDSLGEFLALAPAIEDIGTKGNNPQALVLAECLNQAIAKFLDENRNPGQRNARRTQGSPVV